MCHEGGLGTWMNELGIRERDLERSTGEKEIGLGEEGWRWGFEGANQRKWWVGFPKGVQPGLVNWGKPCKRRGLCF
jgi:hypothetical protein